MSIPKAFCGLCCFLGILNAAHAFDGECTNEKWKEAERAIYNNEMMLKENIFEIDLVTYFICASSEHYDKVIEIQKKILTDYKSAKCSPTTSESLTCIFNDPNVGKNFNLSILNQSKDLLKSDSGQTIIAFKRIENKKFPHDAHVYRDFALTGHGLGYYLTYLFHKGVGGHYQITEESIALAGKKLNYSFTANFIKYISSASTDPDVWAWSIPRAHGQVDMSSTDYKLTENTTQAKENFRQWAKIYFDNAQIACSKNNNSNVKEVNARKAAYLLAFAAHAIQDAVFHAGISNAEHSYMDYVSKTHESVDYGEEMLPRKMKLAKHLTQDLFEIFFQRIKLLKNPYCHQAFGSENNWQVATDEEIRDFTKLTKDSDWEYFKKLKDYAFLGEKVAEIIGDIESKKNDYFISKDQPWFPWFGKATDPGLKDEKLYSTGKQLIEPILTEK